MGYLTKIESAIKLGYSVELIDYFIKKCPKKGQDRKLKVLKTEHDELIDEKELLVFQHYLNQPWPISEKETRPYIPTAIRNDIKQESHYSCAICGYMDNGEIAHIREVSQTFNNSPDNLIYLCPNHHKKYDYGFKISTNVTLDEVMAAKKLKRNSRVRMLRYESNTTKCFKTMMHLVTKIKRNLQKDLTDNERSINTTELGLLLKGLPDLLTEAKELAKKDHDINDVDKKIIDIIPSLKHNTMDIKKDESENDLKNRAEKIISESKKIIIDIDEEECPHCDGRGETGRVGDLCAYCGGSSVVTEEKLEAYDPDDIDEEECPHCNGRGETGRVGDICTYCGGSCVVTEEKSEEYDLGDIDEEECPHCDGRGETGRVGDICAYCGGSCVVTEEKLGAYDPDDIDEEECPHCDGRGETGRVGDICTYCGGSCVVTEEKFEEYDPDDIDEEECPHCDGRGETGRVGDICAYCGGSCVVTEEKSEAYDPDDIDEEECPHCDGRGETGRVGDICALCNGSCVVSAEKREAYADKYGK